MQTNPAMRVANELEASVADLVGRAEALAGVGRRIVLGIVGPPGSGKTTIAAAIARALEDRAAVVPMDGFHLDNPVLVELARRDHKGAPDTFDVGGYVALLQRLRRAEDLVYAPRFDRPLELAIGSAIPVRANVPLVITEGIYLLHDGEGWDAVRPLLDEVWFLDVAPAELHRRLVERRMGDGESRGQATAWVDGVDAVNGELVEQGRPRADLVVRVLDSLPASGIEASTRLDGTTHSGGSMTPGDQSHRKAVRSDLLRFAAGSRHQHGFGYLDDAGVLDADRAVELYVTCRMTHVFALGLLAGEEPGEGGPDASQLRALVDHGVAALLDGPLRDAAKGGWFAGVNPDGSIIGAKQAYAHAFVVLAGSSAVAAGASRGQELLDLALQVQSERFWDETEGLVVEEWNSDWTQLDDYRGVNSNMHTVECYLAAGDVTGDRIWHERAGRIATRVAGWARENQWRIPEHFTTDWQPMLEHNRDQPAHPFQPYGATVGHGLEWARLMVATDQTLGGGTGLTEAAVALADRAFADGWAVDGADGFVYTTDWDGNPVVRARMHWVLAEAIATSTVLARVAGAEPHTTDLKRWWAYADEHLIDHELGSWHHELDETNTPAATTWPGKPDAYHAYQAAIIADLPTTPSFASALRYKQA